MINFLKKNTTPVEAVDVDLSKEQINHIALHTVGAGLLQENDELRKELKDFESAFKYSRSLKKKALQLANENYRIQEMTLTDDLKFFKHQSMVSDNHNKEYKGEIDTLHKKVEELELKYMKEKQITEQQHERLQDLEVAQLNSHRLNEENQSLKKKNIDMQMEILDMDPRFQFVLNKLKKEQCGDRGMMLLDEEENPNLLEQDQLLRNCEQQVKKYEQICIELGQENQSVHQRNGELEKELEQFKRKVCIEAMTHNFERCHKEMEELGGENNVACQKRLEEHQVVQQELEHNLSPDDSYVEQQNNAMEELQEAWEELCTFERKMKNEIVHEKNAQLQLEVLEKVHHEVMQEKESQHEALEQKVQELNEEQHKVMVLEQELQEAQEKLCTFQRVMGNETVHAKKCQLKLVIQCHSDAIALHMIKAGRQEELLPTREVDVEITTKENVKIQIELQSLKSPKPKKKTRRFFRWFRKG
ncbi:golgin subfamily A member 6-like protein 22 [Pseudoliparis swirei]|uniref:golgin subfamily A member 6-like protein 22 n=1 Tax=Pseudoliparis swirei TaxID=2059687 RepID=UPI0024BECF37|nr:golgin subfamily A member 6-like protein 22 [Pseudoliparis swirei]